MTTEKTVPLDAEGGLEGHAGNIGMVLMTRDLV